MADINQLKTFFQDLRVCLFFVFFTDFLKTVLTSFCNNKKRNACHPQPSGTIDLYKRRSRKLSEKVCDQVACCLYMETRASGLQTVHLHYVRN